MSIAFTDRGKRVAELYEANRPRFHDWGTLKDMCIATAIQYADEEAARLIGLIEKEFKKGFFQEDKNDRREMEVSWQQFKAANNLLS